MLKPLILQNLPTPPGISFQLGIPRPKFTQTIFRSISGGNNTKRNRTSCSTRRSSIDGCSFIDFNSSRITCFGKFCSHISRIITGNSSSCPKLKFYSKFKSQTETGFGKRWTVKKESKRVKAKTGTKTPKNKKRKP